MNQPYQLQILRSQRAINLKGNLYLPELCFNLMKCYGDENKNLSLYYQNEQDSKNYQSKQINNQIKLTFKINYLINKCVSANQKQETLEDIYISRMSKFVDKLRRNKMDISQKNTKNNDDRWMERVDFNKKKFSLDKLLNQRESKNSSQFKKVIFYHEISTLLGQLVNRRKQLYQQLCDFYKQNEEQFFKEQISTTLHQIKILEYFKYILQKIFPKQQQKELIFFLNKINQYIQRTQEFFIEASVIAYQPRVRQLSFIVNPVVLALYCNLYFQIKDQQARRHLDNKQKEVKRPEQRPEYIFNHTNINSSLFQKIVYVNLDGQQSPFNLDILRSLSRYIMYVSFPKNYSNHQNSEYQQKQYAYSKMNVDNGFYQNQNEDEKQNERIKKYLMKQTNKEILDKQQQAKAYKKVIRQGSRKKVTYQCQMRQLFHQKAEKIQVNKNIFVFPISSQYLNTTVHQLKENSSVVKHYQSNFVYSTICNIVMKSIIQFVPSMIVVSYNGKIHIDNYHFEQILKLFAVQTNSKIMFCPSFYKCFSHNQQNQKEDENFKKCQQYFANEFNKYQKQTLNLAENDDLFQKIQIFHTVASGKSNLQRATPEAAQIQRYRNIMIKPYVSHLMRMVAQTNDSMAGLKNNYAEEIYISDVLKKKSRFNEYKNMFKVSSLTCKVVQKLRSLIFSQMNEQSIYSKEVRFLANKYNRAEMEQIFQRYTEEKYIQEFSQKERPYTYLKKSYRKFDINNPLEALHAIQFYTSQNGQIKKMHITNKSQVLFNDQFEKQNTKQKGIVYVTNYLVDKQKYINYFGFVQFNESTRAKDRDIMLQKVQLFEFSLNDHLENSQFQVYSNWNYHQTRNYSFLYWPVKFDFIKQGFSKLSKISYVPEEVLSSKIYYMDLSNVGKFTELKYQSSITPLTRCNAFSNQNQGQIQIFVFGGHHYSSSNYIRDQSNVFKLRINKTNFQVDTKIFYTQELPHLSQFEIIKKDEKVFLIGGYGTRYGSLFHLDTGYFYQIHYKDANQNIKCIKHQIKEIKSLLKQNLKKYHLQQQEDGNYELPYEPINIRMPIKLRDNIKSSVILEKFQKKLRIFEKPRHCEATEGYLVSHNFQTIVFDQKIKIYKLISFQAFNFVDPSYYVHSQEYQQFQQSINPTLNRRTITFVDTQQFENNLRLRIGKNNITHEYDYAFSPSTLLRQIRLNNNCVQNSQEFKEGFYDIIPKVKSITKNQQYVVILFNHPRISNNNWVLASWSLNLRTLDEGKKHVLFCEIGRFNKAQDCQHQFMLNLLENGDLILTKYFKNSFEIYLVKQKKIDGGEVTLVLQHRFQKRFEFNLITSSYGNVLVFVIYYHNNNSQTVMQFYRLDSSESYLNSQNNYIFQDLNYRKTLKLELEDASNKLRLDHIQNIRDIFDMDSDKMKVVFYFSVLNENNKKQQNIKQFTVQIDNYCLDLNMQLDIMQIQQ